MKKLCGTEAERAKQLRVNELFIHLTVVRLTVQIEELQDKFEDIETRILRCLMPRLPLL